MKNYYGLGYGVYWLLTAVFQYEPLLYFGKPAGTIHIRVPAKRYAKCQTNFGLLLTFSVGQMFWYNLKVLNRHYCNTKYDINAI